MLSPSFEERPFMTARSLRRASERKARKLAAKEARRNAAQALQQDEASPQHDELLADAQPVTEAQLTANRANAQLSTGPRTDSGKAISSQNAVKTGLTGRTILLPSDDVRIFKAHIQSYLDEYQPEGLREKELVQSLAETRWRLNRIFSLESAIFAKVGTVPTDGDAPLTELDIQTNHEKQLRNLHLQERRLNSRFDRDLEELNHLQYDRLHDTYATGPKTARKELAHRKALAAKGIHTGFVFSTPPRSSKPQPPRVQFGLPKLDKAGQSALMNSID
jgi:hypothetical protein